jgi:hypothetical protein
MSMLETFGRVAVAFILFGAAASGAQESAPPADAPGPAGPQAEAPIDLSPAQAALFDTPHLGNVDAGTTLNYRYVEHGASGEIDDVAALSVTEVLPDGGRKLQAAFLTGDRKEDFPIASTFRGNPMVMLFLQHDVEEMSDRTGGSETYFRNRIRYGLSDGARVEPVDVPYGDGMVKGTRIVLQPFLGDELIGRFPPLAAKTYAFVTSPEVPGQIVSIETDAPGPADDRLAGSSMLRLDPPDAP